MEEMTQLPSKSQGKDIEDTGDDSSNEGIVYILSNESMPGYIKIGVTNGDSPDDVERRMQGLNGTNLPLPFDCDYAAVVSNYMCMEKALHTAFEDFRVNPRREFFKNIKVSRVKAIIDLLMIKVVTPGLIDTEGEEGSPTGQRRKSFTFKMVGIPVGATLQLVGDPDKKCKVAGPNTQVEYDGEIHSISGLAKALKGVDWSVPGTRFWRYEGETLQARRERIEEEARVHDK